MKAQRNKKKVDEFNPIKQEENGKKARRVIWSTKSINMALNGLNKGQKLVSNPFYDNTNLLKGDLVYRRTTVEKEEWIKCSRDIIYFVEKYCKLMTPLGIKHINLRDYQKEYLKHLTQNQLSIFLSCRQSGKTTTSALYLLYYICFNYDKNVLVCGNKRKTAIEILDKCKKIFYELPFFIKPGVYKWNEGEIVLDNGCRIQSEATTVNSGIGLTLHLVLLDEFAHISPTIMDKFYNQIFPTVTAGKSQLIITSTQNGYNLFYRLYKAAEAGDNDYKPFKVDWWQVPEWDPEKRAFIKRDDNWHARQVANYGSERAFNQQFGTNFDVSAMSLVDSGILKKKEQQVKEYVNMIMPGVTHADCYWWDPKYNINNLKNEYIILTGDLAEGRGGDYTVFQINKLDIVNKKVVIRNIGFFRSNVIERGDIATSLQLFICLMLNQEHTLLSWEHNTYGEVFFMKMEDNINKHPIISKMFDRYIYVKYFNPEQTRFRYGIKITSGNKSNTCILFKEDYEKDNIMDFSTLFINELRNFNNDGSNHYRAAFGHDDMVMSLLQIEFVIKTRQYTLFKQDFEELHDEQIVSTGAINYFDTMDNSNITNNFNSRSLYDIR